MSGRILAHVLSGVGLTLALTISHAAQAEILHAYVLIELQGIEEDQIRAGLGRDLGMCKYVIVGTSPTETVGRSETIVRLDCERPDDLNKLITNAGSGIDGVIRASVLAVSRAP